MRAQPTIRLLMCGAVLLAGAQSAAAALLADVPPRAVTVRVGADEMQSLQQQLLLLAQTRLQPAGLFPDARRAWMSVSHALPPAETFDVLPQWPADALLSSLPLRFELRSRTKPVRTIQVTLAVSLQREVLVATRRLRKGSAVACEDFAIERRDVASVPKRPLTTPCTVDGRAGAVDASVSNVEVVALRDIAARDVIRTVDIGAPPDVVAGAPVRLSVTTGGISVSTTAIALVDARIGDQIDVRLHRSTRTLRTRVTGPGVVRLAAQAPDEAAAKDAARREHEAQTMFDSDTYQSLVAENKALRVGDVLTVIVQESASATSTADQRSQRNFTVTAQAGSSEANPHSFSAGATRDGDGAGTTERSGRLLARLSVRVTDVNPNGDLVVSGQQSLRINGEEQRITLSGIVRPRDVTDGNIVLSSRIAEARIRFDGKGFVTDQSKPGWLVRLFTYLGL